MLPRSAQSASTFVDFAAASSQSDATVVLGSASQHLSHAAPASWRPPSSPGDCSRGSCGDGSDHSSLSGWRARSTDGFALTQPAGQNDNSNAPLGAKPLLDQQQLQTAASLARSGMLSWPGDMASTGASVGSSAQVARKTIMRRVVPALAGDLKTCGRRLVLRKRRNEALCVAVQGSQRLKR